MYTLDTKKQKNIVDSFQQVVDKQNSHLISEELYSHLNLNCNFSSHFNLQGFQDAYSGDHFQEFLENFDRNSPQSQWLEAPEISQEFLNLNQTLVDYATSRTQTGCDFD